MPNTHIWPCGNTSHNPIRKAQHSHLSTNVEKDQNLHSAMRGTNRPCWKDLHLHMTTNVRKAQHLYLTMQGTNPSCRKGSALTSDNQCQKGSALTSTMEGSNPLTMIEWKQPLYLIKWEHIPQSHQNGHALTSDHVRLHLTIVSERPSVLDQVFLVTY